MIPAAEFNQLTNKFKESLNESAVLNKAARLSAEKQAMLTHLPADQAVSQIKPLSREIGILTKRIRQGPKSIADAGDDDDDLLLHTPEAVMLKKLLAQKANKKAGPSTPKGKRKLPTPPSQPATKQKKASWASKEKASSSATPSLPSKIPTPKDLYKKGKFSQKLKPQQGWEDWQKGKKLSRPLAHDDADSY